MRRLSLTARRAQEDHSSGEVEVVLMEITHPEMDAPVRLSSDPTERLSDDPPVYCTRSSWKGANPVLDPYLSIVASVLLPSDQEDDPAVAALVLENLDAGIPKLLRSFTTAATISIAVVLASSPDEIEAEWSGLRIVSSEITATEVSLRISREEIELEYFPTGRMTRDRFPGLHR